MVGPGRAGPDHLSLSPAGVEPPAPTMPPMDGPMAETSARSWLRCYRCWSQDLEVQVHYEGIHKIDPDTGERAEVVDELQEAVVQCLDCMHDQPHLGFNNGRVEPIEDRWERMIAGTPWVASCTVAVDAEDVETCSGPAAGHARARGGPRSPRAVRARRADAHLARRGVPPAGVDRRRDPQPRLGAAER